ncbi:hypothetical protein MNBD_GAMMA08-1490 [hydrothermal vent metagenome]|uniref:PEP-CTERM protein-sorting domain-containing protein n=1 Tax=hydrothermal vent metagenome TaxID=652676 RepID=A0A3B0X9Z7_9ZZZZ
MNNKMIKPLLTLTLISSSIIISTASASPISVLPDNNWYNFAMSRDAEGAATGCLVNTCLTPAPNSIFADAPAWTFSGPALFEVTDAFDTGDILDIYDNGVFVGTTSFSTVGLFDRNLNPDDALLDPNYSSGSFLFGAGDHSITIFNNIDTTQLGGAAYFRLSNVSPVPVPAALPLLLSGIVGLGLFSRRKKQ